MRKVPVAYLQLHCLFQGATAWWKYMKVSFSDYLGSRKQSIKAVQLPVLFRLM